MAHDPVYDEDVAEIAQLTAEAASAYIRGDIRRYLTFIRHADDYTLLPPLGGEPRRGFDSSDEALEATARFFQGGQAEVEVVESYASGDLVVLVVIERQHGEVGDLPDQDWSLRVTLAYLPPEDECCTARWWPRARWWATRMGKGDNTTHPGCPS